MMYKSNHDDMFALVIDELEKEQRIIRVNLPEGLVGEVVWCESIIVPVLDTELLFAYYCVIIINKDTSLDESFKVIDYKDILSVEVL